MTWIASMSLPSSLSLDSTIFMILLPLSSSLRNSGSLLLIMSDSSPMLFVDLPHRGAGDLHLVTLAQAGDVVEGGHEPVSPPLPTRAICIPMTTISPAVTTKNTANLARVQRRATRSFDPAISPPVCRAAGAHDQLAHIRRDERLSLELVGAAGTGGGDQPVEQVEDLVQPAYAVPRDAARWPRSRCPGRSRPDRGAWPPRTAPCRSASRR
jgi:hypothetical protein